jgi:iron complex transport system ATP-binding protein
MTLLSADNISLSVSERLLCKALSLHVQAGECWGILGPNGSGKTTLLHTLAGLYPLQQGKIQLNSDELSSLSRQQVAQHLGLLLQDNHDPFPATVEETALSGRHPHLGLWQGETDTDRALARAALQRMELGGMAHRQVQTLSGGERRRLAFATLLTQDVPVQLLDEPLNHLDLRHQRLLLETVREQCGNGKAALMVLHDPNQAVNYCDRVLLLQGDGSWQSGTAGEMLTERTLSALYGCDIREVETDGKRWFSYL